MRFWLHLSMVVASAILLFSPACRNPKIVASETRPEGESDSGNTDSTVDTDSDTAPDTSSDTGTGPDTETGSNSDTGADTGSVDGTDTGDTDSGTGCGVPETFLWRASAPLITPPDGALAIKDPTVVLLHDGSWHVYATIKPDSGEPRDWSLTHLSFTDWDHADAAPKRPAGENPNLGDAYMAAPQLFYFAPQELWYLVFQTQAPAYATSETPGDMGSWSAPVLFMSMPDIITDSETGGIDYWVICDETDCYLFFSADNGVLYRARTAKGDFPDGFEGTTEIVMTDEKFALYEACNVYQMAGTGQYLLLVSAISPDPEIHRYFRAWTSDRLDGSWTPLADTEDNAFASVNNVIGGEWAGDGINHGEMLRTNPDERMIIDTCDMRYLFQGHTAAGADYPFNAYSLGLLTDAR